MAVLQVKSLEKVYNTKSKEKQIKAVNNLDFHVKQGEILGLLGPNGAGKTTTISILSTLILPTSGEVIYKGQCILKNPKAIQDELGYVPQDIALYTSLSASNNLKFWGKLYGLNGKLLKERIDEVLEITGLADRKDDVVEKFSGGMKRRLNIGAALLHKPPFIIMDEPTVGIDPQSRKYILDLVRELNKQGSTVIYTSHYMEEVESLCSRICIMDQGISIANGTKDELLNSIKEGETILIKVINNHEKVIRALRELNFVTEVEENEGTVVVRTEKVDNSSHQIVETLSKTNVNITSLEIRKPSLETVFLSLTGRNLRD